MFEDLSKVTIYDFDRPDKFSFENLRSLESIMSVFARNFATDLSGELRMPVEVDVKKIEQVPFGPDFVDKRVKDESVFVVTNLNKKDQILLQMDVGFLLCVHAKQGGGDFGKITKVKKNITEFEKITIENLVTRCVYPPLEESFDEVANYNFSVERIDTDPQYAKVTYPYDMVALTTFDIHIGSELTEMSIVFPYMAIETCIDYLNSDHVLKNRIIETPSEQLFYLYDHILQTKRMFEVELGVTYLSIQQILNLDVDNILMLNNTAVPIYCKFGGKDKFVGKIGSQDGQSAVKIIGIVKEVEGKEEKIEKFKEQEDNQNAR